MPSSLGNCLGLLAQVSNHGVLACGRLALYGEKQKLDVWEFFFDRWKWWIAFLRLKKRRTRKSHFLDFWLVGHHNVRVEISADRPEIGRIMLPTPPDTSKLFPNKKNSLCRTHSGGILKFVFWVLGLKNAYFGKVLRLLPLLRFWVPRCCFLKSSKSGLSEKYMVYGVIPSR